MGKKHKHEEHVNHERWLVSFADMMTLLFALFVVLYALGQADLEKAKALKNSIQWAFHIAGEGKTKDTGLFDRQQGAGDIEASAPLLTAQDGEMREFLKEQLERFEEVAGRSLEIVQTDDTIAFTAPINDFFKRGAFYPVERGVDRWLEGTLSAAMSFASRIRIQINSHDVPIGYSRKKPVSSVDLSIERLKTMERYIFMLPEVKGPMVSSTWHRLTEKPGFTASRWEEESTITVSFSNAESGG